MRVPWRALNQRINAFVAVNVDAHFTRIGPHDIAVAIKDNICTADLPTTCSSAILEGFRSPFDATVVRLLREAPIVRIIGKTNCDEFGMGSLNVHSSHGPVINPFDLDCPPRSAGGSSGGSAAAVAAGLCDVALATDTGGSTRLPASYCGIVGFKPSYGLLSRWGLVSYADSLDCIGIMSKEVEKTRQIFYVLNEHDTNDPTSVPSDIRQQLFDTFNVQNFKSARSVHTFTGLRVGIPQEYFPSELSPHIKLLIARAAAILEEEGATIVPVSLPSTPYALSAYYVIASAEASSNLARFDGVRYGLHVPPPRGSDLSTTSNVYAHTRSRGFGREAQKRILLGTYALTADAFDNYFLQALKIRQLVRDDFNKVFRTPNILSTSATHPTNDSGVDVLLHPSAIQTAPLLENDHVSKLDTYVQDVLTVPASLAGLPALSVPMKNSPSDDEKYDSWPMGLSIVGQWGSDELVLEVGKTIERRQSS